METGTTRQIYTNHKSQITAVEMHTQSPTLVLSSSLFGPILVHDLRLKEPVKSLQEGDLSKQGWALTACWSTDGRKIFAGHKNELGNAQLLLHFYLAWFCSSFFVN